MMNTHRFLTKWFLVMALVVPPTAAQAAKPAEAYAALTTDGAWCWFADPRAVSHEGKTFTGWVAENGSIQAAMLDHTSGNVTVVDLHKEFESDDHDNPAFLFLPDGRLMALYSKHCGPDMNARVTTRPGDISEWGPERVMDLFGEHRPGRNITYPNPVMLSAEDNAIYLFWRGDTWKPTFSKSTDGGQLWSPCQVIVSRPGAGGDNRPYVKIASNGRDRIHMIFTDGHPRKEPKNNVYYACYRDGAFYKADGTLIAGELDLPFTPEQADLVYDASVTGARAWVWDVAEDREGRPVVAYTRLPSEKDHRHHYARWDGQGWSDTELCAAGKWFPQTRPARKESEPHYSGGLALDHANPSVVYLSRPVDGIFEIERWHTMDGGKSWQSDAVTEGSSTENVRPFVVRNAVADGPKVLWMNLNNRYLHYTDFHTAIKTDHPASTLIQLPGASAPIVSPAEPPAPLSAAIEPETILTAMERVADWQLAHPSHHRPTDWTQGAGYTGFMALDGISDSRRFREAMIRMGRSNLWKPGPRLYHADDHAVGQTYCELFLKTQDTNMIAPLRQSFDRILAQPKQVESLKFAGEGDVWSWCDALFMSPPAWMRLWKSTGDARYYDFAVTNWWRTSDYLYDPEEHLYFRDSTFFDKRETNGAKIFWSRGNGWVMAGLVRMMQVIPKDSPDRVKFERQFKEMGQSILACQQPDGLWRSSLLDADSYPLKETSGSSFYCYALAWGVNEGLLDRKDFEPAVRKAWTALVACVQPNGKLTHVQPIGADPRKFDPNSTEIYGVGAFLLAGSEVYRMAARNHAAAANGDSTGSGHPPDGYELVWADEFEGGTLDTNKWIHWLSGKRRDAINTADAVTLSDGTLNIATYTEDNEHSTGMISTKQKFEPQFGYLEARIDFDSSPGMWSAFWMQSPTMGRPVGNPQKAGIEIDIVEHRSLDRDGTSIDGQGIANLHWDGYGRHHKSRGSSMFGSNLGTGFHTYALKWTPDTMTFYVDQQQVWNVTDPVSRSREFIILSSEVDANAWVAKIPESGYGSRETSKTRMKVDYVRVYQRNPEAAHKSSETRQVF